MLPQMGLRVMRAVRRQELGKVSADTSWDGEVQSSAIAVHESSRFEAFVDVVRLLPAANTNID